MLRKIRNCLLCTVVLFNTTGWAATYTLAPNYERKIELPANVPQIMHNPMIWKVTAKCTVSSEDSANVIIVLGKNKSGSVNGKPISEGETFPVLVHPLEVLTIVAEPGAKVQLTNAGPHTVNAHCSA
ncbi:MAG: hypothetical protein H0T84_13215 [Tatlockia sp.]|nr:hypothetical protein [Tatlockia sp.]